MLSLFLTLFGLAVSFGLGALSADWAGGHALTASLLWKAAIFFFLLSVSVPFVPGTRRAILRYRMTRALKITFDPTNPARNFYSLENAPLAPGATEPVVYWEYRVEVTNTSSANLRNVRVTSRGLGVVGSRPEAMPFDLTKKDVADFTPGQSMLLPILRWPHPAVQPGMVVGAYGPIDVVVTADGVLPLRRLFQFDHRRTPMIYDWQTD